MVLFINRKDYNDNKIKEAKPRIVEAELIIAKHRKGAVGHVDLLFELNMSSFRNVLKTNEEVG